ncbi:MAG: hypothetical protein ACR2GY_01715 [Phycisphaerales bacterium]
MMQQLMHFRAIIPAVALVFLATLAGGCASRSSGTGDDVGGGTGGGGGSSPSAIATLKDNGLEARLWVVPDSSLIIGQALTELTRPVDLPDGRDAALFENGFRLHEFDVDLLPDVLAALGGSVNSQEWWYGQVFDWRELWKRQLNMDSRGIAVDGRVRSFAGGGFLLLMRSWTIRTELGPRVQFELAPYYENRPGAYRQSQNTVERGVLIAEGPPGEAFPSVAFQMQLEPRRAYILTSESPAMRWAPSGEGLDDIAAQPPTAPRGSRGPDVGPRGAAPTTLGEYMLGAETTGTTGRIVIVLIPHLPAALFPNELLEVSSGQ